MIPQKWSVFFLVEQAHNNLQLMKLAFTLNNFHTLCNVKDFITRMQIYIHLLRDLCPLLTLTEDFLHDCVTTIHWAYIYENSISVLCSSLYNQNPHECSNVRQQQNQSNTNMPVARRICISFILALRNVNWTVNRPSTESLFWRREILFWCHCLQIIILRRSAEIS